MNKKFVAVIALVALILGGLGTMAYQTRAQNSGVGLSTSSPATSTVADVKTAQDTDNVQDDNGAVDQPDAVGSAVTDKETKDDKGGATMQKDTQEQTEGTAADVSEGEDSN